MINEKELNSMVYLLDDSDERVVEQIEQQISALGLEVIPFLEKSWPEDDSPTRQERVVQLIKNIKENSLAKEMQSWLENESNDLLAGLLIINKIANPSLDRQVVENKLDKLKLDAWLEMNYDLTSFEKVKILNHIIFDVHQFKGDTGTYHHSKNSFINSVLDRKVGNPISLAVIYSIVAQRLNIPIYGVNLPQHFVLGYVQDFDWPPLLRFNDQAASGNEAGENIMFYINPFNNGLIFNRENIEKFLKKLNLEPKEDYFKTCGNKDIVLRVLRNLEVSFAKENNESKLGIVKKMIKTFSLDE